MCGLMYGFNSPVFRLNITSKKFTIFKLVLTETLNGRNTASEILLIKTLYYYCHFYALCCLLEDFQMSIIWNFLVDSVKS